MAVKKPELVDSSSQLELASMAQYFQMMNDHMSTLPPLPELIKHCQDIVSCLAYTEGTAEQLWQMLEPVENYLLRSVTSEHQTIRNEVFTAIIEKIYAYISDPEYHACPATAAALIIIDEVDETEALTSARLLVEKTENGPDGTGLRAALTCLYRWLDEWQTTPSLGFWILAFIKALEISERDDVLLETSQDCLVSLISILTKETVHQHTANVIFHVIASLRESVEAFDRIAYMVSDVLVHLASESSQWSRQILQDLVDVLIAMVERISSCLDDDDAVLLFRQKYSDVITCLERHMTSRASVYLHLPVWRTRKPDDSVDNHLTKRKVGLLNLGNTCYMNSVVQALLVTRQFSSYVVLNKITIPYWEKLGELFCHMMFTLSAKLDPDACFNYLRPPFFTLYMQHDSSEFLSYLLELLQSYEHSTETNHDYTRPPVLTGGMRTYQRYIPPPSPLSDDQPGHSGQNGRSLSPRPGSSNGPGASCTKRVSMDMVPSSLPPRKRFRLTEAYALQRDSAIDNMFGGVLLTRIQCTVCKASSLSRDVFRDLQLAFPEKPEDGIYSVQSLLEYYCTKERLSGDNRYQCQDCGMLRDAERSVLIESTPKYLILVLKNFKLETKVQVQVKLMNAVHYDHTITLPTVRNQAGLTTYNVFAAVIHTGTTLDSGHYYTIAKDNGQWHRYNDCSITYVDESHLNKLNHSSTPYILFYRRSDVEEPAPPTFDQVPARIQDDIAADNKLYVETTRKLRID